METQKNRLLPVILIAVICGLAAGITGEIITRVYFLKDFSVPYFNNNFNLADLDYNRASLIIRDAKKVVVSQDVKVDETINSVRPALVGIFKDQGIAAASETISGTTTARTITTGTTLTGTATTSTTTAAVASSAYYKLDEPEIMGLVVTADGWIAASLPAGWEKDFLPENYVAITSDRKIYKLEQMSDFQGLPGNLVFFRLVGANNLPVKKIASRAEISLGQSVLVINDFNNVLLTSLSSFKKTPAVLSSDTLNARFILAGGVEDNFNNSFVFNLAGDLVAVIGPDKEVVPAFAYSYYRQSFFKKGNAYQPLFGVNYLDLRVTKPLEIVLEKGAWLKGADNAPAVIAGSPAAVAGLQAGDVITWINNREINASNDLADIISTFKPGDTINVTYWRAGEDKTVSVKLGERK